MIKTPFPAPAPCHPVHHVGGGKGIPISSGCPLKRCAGFPPIPAPLAGDHEASPGTLRSGAVSVPLEGAMINNGDAIGRLKALLHLRGAHKGSSRRERVDGELLRLRGIMSGTRRARASRQNLPRLQGARELMPAVCPALRPCLREPSCGCLPRCGKVLKASPLGKLSSG